MKQPIRRDREQFPGNYKPVEQTIRLFDMALPTTGISTPIFVRNEHQQVEHTPAHNRSHARIGALQMKNQLLTVAEVAEQLGVCRGTIWNKVYSREISSFKLGRSRRIDQSEVQRMLDEAFEPARPCQ